MAPFFPDPFPESLNLVFALVVGMGFGFVLEQAGFSSARRLTGVFYGYDFAVLRVFFTAAITAMVGVILLGSFGLLDTSVIYVNPTWVLPAILGGIIMGLGFILGGYCPGTGVCAAAIGKVDAWWFVGGSLGGVFLFGELFPLYQKFYESTARGPIRVFDALGMSQGVFVCLLICMAIGAFTLTSRIERKVAPDQAPSLSFNPLLHGLAALGVVLLGVVVIFLPDHKSRVLARAGDPTFKAAFTLMEPDELALRLVDQDPATLVVDLRPPEARKTTALPGSLRLTVDEFFSRDALVPVAPRRIRKVVVAEDEALARLGANVLQALGFENLSVLKGGFPAFRHSILEQGTFQPTGSRWDNDVQTFRASARVRLMALMEAEKQKTQAAPKVVKKVQAGC